MTIEAMRFAIDEGLTIFVMHRAGEALAVLTDAPTVGVSAHALELRRAQFAATPRQRLGGSAGDFGDEDYRHANCRSARRKTRCAT